MKRTAALILLLATAALAQNASSPAPSGLARITPSSVRAHIEYLADDLMEGRAPGTRGGELAAKYIASRLEAMGLEPGGVNGTYFQPVPFREYSAVPEKTSVALVKDGNPVSLKWLDEYLTTGNPFEGDVKVETGIVFVGYGADVPRRNLNDYAGVDVRGKIVAILRGGSPMLPAEERAHYSTGNMLAASAAKHGAVGIILLPTPEYEKEAPYAKSAQNLQSAMRWIGPDGTPFGIADIKVSLGFSPTMVDKLFEGHATTLAQVMEELKAGKPQAFETAFKLRAHIATKSADIISPNIIAIRRGTDPKLKGEFLVYSAHYDHLGIGKPVNGDALYNGAWDNATGVTSVLNIADAFANTQAPARSVAFVFVTAEEKGLLGSDYFAQFSTLPKNSVVANINIDMIPFFSTYKEVVIGPDRVGVNRYIESAAKTLGLPTAVPQGPQRGGGAFMTRSDGYSFIRQGIPVFGVSLRGDPKDMESFRNMYGTRYHQPSDDMTMPFNWDAGATFAKMNFLVGYEVANSDSHPGWKSDDWLAEVFGQKAATATGAH